MSLFDDDAEALKDLQRLEELRAEYQRKLRAKYPTPGHLARHLDPATVQTPALDIIDAHLVQVRDALDVMYTRRERFGELIRQGVDKQIATEQASEEIEAKGITRLGISMSPQEGKSQRVTRYGTLWLLRQFPNLRSGLVSYDGANANQFSYQIRSDIELFDGIGSPIDLDLKLAKDQKAMGRWLLRTGGGVYAIGIGGGLAGRPLDYGDIDDPVKDLRAADSLLLSQQAWEWWQTVMRPRLAPWAPVVVVSTRWHEADLMGRMIAQEKIDADSGVKNYDKWTIVNIPAEAEFDPEKGETDILGREPGEFMVSARGRTRADWEATKAATAPRYWISLYQGKPSPDTGNIWLREWWPRYHEAILTLGEDQTYRANGYDLSMSWDCTFRDTKASDFVVGQVWAKKGSESFLLHQLRRRMTFTETLDAIKRLHRLFPQIRRVLIEGKANGDAVIDSLNKEIAGIITVDPTKSKTVRAEAVSPFVRAGNAKLPSAKVLAIFPDLAWDVEAFIEECTSFPNGTHDDQVDATSQYLAEAYLVGSEATITQPTGQIPRKTSKPLARLGKDAMGSRQQILTRRAMGK